MAYRSTAVRRRCRGTRTFFGDDSGTLEVALVGDEHQRFVERLARTLGGAVTDSGNDVGGFLKRAPVRD